VDTAITSHLRRDERVHGRGTRSSSRWMTFSLRMPSASAS
jgi:hypothetical protein